MVAYLIQHSMQLISCLNNSISVITIYHKNKTLSVLEVMPPKRTNLYMQGKNVLLIHTCKAQK